jgi:TPR repeat protein
MGGFFTKELKRVLAKNAENGYPWAQYILGINHVGLSNNRPGNDFVFKRKKSRGMDLLHLAAKQGYPPAVYQLAQMYRNRDGGIQRCMELGNHLMRLAAQQGHGLAGLIMYDLSEKDGDFEMAKKYLKDASLAGSGEASFLIGSDYHTGSNGVTEDLSAALEYYKLGAERGQADAQWGAAELSRKLVAKGKAGEEDEIKYLRMAAEQGHTAAQCLLGTVLLDFKGEWTRGKTWSEAVRWLRRAKSGGDSTAAMRLERLESDTGNLCFNCGAKATEAEKFSRCSKCLGSYYCSRTCQKEHWHSSHKNHCVKHDEPLPSHKMKMNPFEAAGIKYEDDGRAGM